MSAPDPELADLLATVQLDGPVEPFRQLADRLKARGDPWGALIEAQLAGQRDEALEREISAGQPLQRATWHRGFLRAAAIGPLAAPGTAEKGLAEAAGKALDGFLQWGPASKLESLELLPRDGGADDRVDGYVRSTSAFPATLRHLRAAKLVYPDVFVGLIGGRRNVLPQLETLDLSDGGLDSRRCEFFWDKLPRLRHLKVLDLRGNLLEAADAERILAAVPGARVTDQRVSAKLDTSQFRESEHNKFLRLHGKLSAEDYD